MGLIARDEASLHSTREELQRFGAMPTPCRRTSPTARRWWMPLTKLSIASGAIDVWVNNAMGPFWHCSEPSRRTSFAA